MPENFELTFFLVKNAAKKKNAKKQMLEVLALREGRERFSSHQYPLFVGKDVLFDVFEYEEADFNEYRICLADLVLTQKNLENKVKQLLQVVDVCFSQMDSILFATGIYELTYDCIKGVKRSKDFDGHILSKFPILFFRVGHENGFQPSYNSANVSCVINKDAQDIFANPVSELMEDYGMSFEEAQKRANWN